MEQASGSSSRQRLLQAAKHLFATRGYENSSTAMIAREAGTSESQLMKHFGSKNGLLEAVFEEGWVSITEGLRSSENDTPSEQLRAALEQMLKAMHGDLELRDVMLLEARRVRKEGPAVLVSDGFLKFMHHLDALLQRMSEVGELLPGLQPEVVRSALIGAVEGMLRDELVARRNGQPTHTFDDIRRIFNLLVRAFLTDQGRFAAGES
jgi:AcrR family transcriptional regulator